MTHISPEAAVEALNTLANHAAAPVGPDGSRWFCVHCKGKTKSETGPIVHTAACPLSVLAAFIEENV